MSPKKAERTIMPIHLRPLDSDTDLPRYAELYSLVDSVPVTADLIRERDSRRLEGQVHRRMLAVSDDDQLVGFNEVIRIPWQKPGRFWMLAVVDPAWKQQGIGSHLYDDALQFAQSQGASELRCTVRDQHPEGLRFAQQRGFGVDRHLFESTLALASFDEQPFKGTIEAQQASGLRFFTLADAGMTEKNQHKLYELNRSTAADNPSSDGTFPPFEQFRKNVFEASWFNPAGQILAADGEAWVGLAAVGYFADPKLAYNMFTGVERNYRGRKLALALKLLATQFAHRCGAATIRTNNDSQNAPMLAINRKLGYQPLPGFRIMTKALI
jgi:GNAT superfamily N-acetyltransferase